MANTNVKGTENNAKQEIKAMGEVVPTPTMTEQEHKEHMETMFNYGLQGRLADMSLKVEIKTSYDKKEHLLDGYNDTTKSFYKWAEDKFELKETQVKQAIRVIPIFGTLDDKGYWSMQDKYKAYGLEKLDRIQSHPKFKLADFDTFTESLGITDKSTVADIKAIVAEAKGKTTGNAQESATDNAQESATDNTLSIKEVAEIKNSAPYKELDSKKDILLKFTSEHFIEAQKIADSKKDKLAMSFVLKFIDDFKAMEQEYNNAKEQ